MPTKEELQTVFDSKVAKLRARQAELSAAVDQALDELCEISGQLKLLEQLSHAVGVEQLSIPVVTTDPTGVPVPVWPEPGPIPAMLPSTDATEPAEAIKSVFNMPQVVPTVKKKPMTDKVLEYVAEHPELTAVTIAKNMAIITESSAKDPITAIQCCISGLLGSKRLIKDGAGRITLPGADTKIKTAGKETQSSALLHGALDRIVTFLRVNGSAKLETIADSTQLSQAAVSELLLKHEDLFVFKDGRYTVVR